VFHVIIEFYQIMISMLFVNQFGAGVYRCRMESQTMHGVLFTYIVLFVVCLSMAACFFFCFFFLVAVFFLVFFSYVRWDEVG
jgi:hypothetical protein